MGDTPVLAVGQAVLIHVVGGALMLMCGSAGCGHGSVGLCLWVEHTHMCGQGTRVGCMCVRGVDLSPRPSAAKPMGWHWARDRVLGSHPLHHQNICARKPLEPSDIHGGVCFNFALFRGPPENI